MKDYRLQGQSPEDLCRLTRVFQIAAPLTSRLSCRHCGDSHAWFFCFTDMVVCERCFSRSLTFFPRRFSKKKTNRIQCTCGDYRKAVYPKKITCKRCGKVETWKESLEVQPLFEVVSELG